MRQYPIEIDDRTYTGTTASAKEQFEALHIAGRTGLAGLLVEEGVKPHSIVVMLISIPYQDLERLRSLLVKDKVIRDSDEVPVAENLFRDEIHNYYLIIAHAIRENLGGFSKLRRQTGAPTAEPTPSTPTSAGTSGAPV
ncbi:hypothetical protein [Alloalcanivorax xenomutans]